VEVFGRGYLERKQQVKSFGDFIVMSFIFCCLLCVPIVMQKNLDNVGHKYKNAYVSTNGMNVEVP